MGKEENKQQREYREAMKGNREMEKKKNYKGREKERKLFLRKQVITACLEAGNEG